jgi:hypothetical protein
MSSKAALGVLTQRLSPNGHQRLFEFLDIIDTATAARFRTWLNVAPDVDVSSAANLLNRASHGNEFSGWWRSRDALSVVSGQQTAETRTRTPLERRHSQARARAANADLTIGGVWLVIGILVTIASYALTMSTGGGSYLVASGAMIYGALRLFRGFRGG